jgi:hypothetical protein
VGHPILLFIILLPLMEIYMGDKARGHLELGYGTIISERLSEASVRRRNERTAKRKRQFVKGPIPLRWLERAASLPGKAFTVGIVLWFKSGIEGGGPFTVSNNLFSRFGIGRKAAARAYSALADQGLIHIDRGPGRLPRVGILDLPT